MFFNSFTNLTDSIQSIADCLVLNEEGYKSDPTQHKLH